MRVWYRYKCNYYLLLAIHMFTDITRALRECVPPPRPHCAKCCVLVYLFIVICTVYGELRCQLRQGRHQPKGSEWLFAKINKHCGKVEVLQLSDLRDPRADYFHNLISLPCPDVRLW